MSKPIRCASPEMILALPLAAHSENLRRHGASQGIASGKGSGFAEECIRRMLQVSAILDSP
jgi:hypothetical protein